MRIFTATLITETNTFAVVPTSLADFEVYGIHHGDASQRDPKGIGGLHAQLHALAVRDGHELVESLCAFAQPAGRTSRAVYESFRDEILTDLRAALPLQVVQLYLHGAMVADGYDDCEGDLIEHVRSIVGSGVHIGVELDLHCHFTERMCRHADAIIAYKEYPHTDILERAAELYRIAIDHLVGRISPVTEVFDLRMVGKWHTTEEPVKSFVQRMQALEGKDGVLSISLGHGFGMGDVADCGAKLWVITDNDPAQAAALAQQLGREFWEMRDAVPTYSFNWREALTTSCTSAQRPVVLADTGDNPGGGAMSDATFVLRALVDDNIGNAALGFFWDLGAVHLCKSAGVGATLDLRIGGKCGPQSGDPVDVRVTVRAIRDGQTQFGIGLRSPLGTAVWVQTADDLDLVLVSIRGQVMGPEVFNELGIDLRRKDLIVVKSAQHFHAQFAPIAGSIVYLSTPGSTIKDYAKLPYKIRDLNYWPRVADPFVASA